ncbi:MAG: M23 family metallopeptidase [Chloroflexi bacterium]|nr:MAG: M23 family metallopeptidase [Chloroflexota bacterium]TMF38486.1 MAG: M23 family metallopeptidase [Chloroflexota bacterium]
MTRLVALAVGAVAVFLVGATQVPSHMRLPVATVVIGAVITQPFGCTALQLEPFDPACPSHHVHTGIDLAAPVGTDVNSATSGEAITGYDPAGAGNYVLVIAGVGVRILYCHLSGFAVRSGAPVSPGEVIGFVGATGLATGPHVHLQVDVDGVPVDPAVFLAS